MLGNLLVRYHENKPMTTADFGRFGHKKLRQIVPVKKMVERTSLVHKGIPGMPKKIQLRYIFVLNA